MMYVTNVNGKLVTHILNTVQGSKCSNNNCGYRLQWCVRLLLSVMREQRDSVDS